LKNTKHQMEIIKQNNNLATGLNRPLINKAARIFTLTAVAGGAAEITLDGGAEAAIVTGNFSGVEAETNMSIGNAPGGSQSIAMNWYGIWSWSNQEWIPAQASSSSSPMVDVVGGSVGTALTFGDYGKITAGFDGYIGFRFLNDNDTDFHYGYVRAQEVNGNGMKLGEWAYEDQINTSIAAPTTLSAIPEPSSLALLAMGAAAMGTYRRRQK